MTQTTTTEAQRPLWVRQIPAAHAYVEHLRPLDRAGEGEGTAYPQVVTLPDPPVPGAPAGQWWPHPALEADWVREHVREQDLMHLHFGTEGRTVEELAAWLGALRTLGLPLVHTVHDIDHPHLRDQTRHREHLALLAQEADGLLTLSVGAAAAVEHDYGRPRERSGPLRVGVHLKGLRTNLAPMRVLPPLVEAVRRLRDGGTAVDLEVRAHPEILDEQAPRHDAEVAAWWQQQAADPPPGVELVLAPRLDDEALWDYLEGLDVSVLPYAWATHSGWVEACRDLGTWVLAPDVGHLLEQGAGGVLGWADPGMPPPVTSLVELLGRAAQGPPAAVTRSWREDQREQVAAVHARVYEAVVAGHRVDASTAQQWQIFGGDDGSGGSGGARGSGGVRDLEGEML